MRRLSSTRRRLAPIPPILISSRARLSVTVISGPLTGDRGSVGPGVGSGLGSGVGAGLGGRFAALAGGRPEHGLDDVLVAGAATQVAREREPHLVLGRVGVAVQQGPRGEHHARGAEAALEPVLGGEPLLGGGPLPTRPQAPDG